MAGGGVRGPPYRAVHRIIGWTGANWSGLEFGLIERTGLYLADVPMRFGLAWVYREMVRSFPDGAADVDAWLAGEVMPSTRSEQSRRMDVLLSAGGEVS